MFKITTFAGLALAGTFAASGASANNFYNHSYSPTISQGSVFSTTYTSPTTYTAPTINLGPIEQVQPNSTVQYVQPATTYVQPAKATTYTAPVTSYVAQPTYTTQTYVAPARHTVQTNIAPSNYTTPSYAAQPVTYTAPSYVTQPTYTAPTIGTTFTTPAYIAPRYDGIEMVRDRMDRLRSRIRHALDRGDLREGERRKLRRKMRDIRDDIRDFRANDGIIDRAEHAALNKKMSRQSRRIARLANNHRVERPLVSPYAYFNRF